MSAFALCPQMVLLHRSYPSVPHRCAASFSDTHSHGAVQTGGTPVPIVCVSAMIPTAALTVPHKNATIPRIMMILTCFSDISYHHYLAIPGRGPGLHGGESGEPVFYIFYDYKKKSVLWRNWHERRVRPRTR
jgi:hypothetical protein